MFLPITATPFSHSGYSELLPCKNLAPFVRCFWTTWNDGSNVNDFSSVIIPDACADIIISVDENESNSDEREISGMGFCGTTDKMFRSKNSGIVHRRLFGIRFYAWQAFNFCDEPLAETANRFFDLEEHFATAKKMLCRKIHEDMTLSEFKNISEEVLLDLLNMPSRKITKQDSLVLDAVVQLIRTRGSLPLSSLLKDIHAGERQLERLFKNTVSLSPKKFSSLVRYQSLWQDVCRSENFDIQDAVFKYGYFDQPHLLNDFKKFHGMSFSDAVNAALSDFYNTKKQSGVMLF